MKSPTSQRAEAIADHMESFGAYTQADEIRALAAERDALRNALNIARSGLLAARLLLMR